jgi:PAS domain S-box-containing protein
MTKTKTQLIKNFFIKFPFLELSATLTSNYTSNTENKKLFKDFLMEDDKNIELAMQENEDVAICITCKNLEPPGPQILFVNDAFCNITGYSKEELIGKTPRILQGEKTDKNTLNRMKILLASDDYFEGNIINYKKNGEEYTMVWNISPVKQDNEIQKYISIQKEINNKNDETIMEELEKIKDLNRKILSNINNYLER